jgi:hypothetical protein
MMIKADYDRNKLAVLILGILEFDPFSTENKYRESVRHIHQ